MFGFWTPGLLAGCPSPVPYQYIRYAGVIPHLDLIFFSLFHPIFLDFLIFFLFSTFSSGFSTLWVLYINVTKEDLEGKQAEGNHSRHFS